MPYSVREIIAVPSFFYNMPYGMIYISSANTGMY